MFSSITPHNNEWNRKYTFTERGKGFLRVFMEIAKENHFRQPIDE